MIGIRPHAVRLGAGRDSTPGSSPTNGSATRAISRSTSPGKLMVVGLACADRRAQVGESVAFDVAAPICTSSTPTPARSIARPGGGMMTPEEQSAA